MRRHLLFVLGLITVAGCTGNPGNDAGGSDAIPDESSDGMSDGSPDAGSACTFTSPHGAGISGLTVEGCTFDGPPPGVNALTDIAAVALEPGGNAMYLIFGDAAHRSTARFVDDAAPGCQWRRDASWTSPLPAGETPAYVDVAPDFTVYVASEHAVGWSGGSSGMCASSATGFGTRASMQVGSDRRLVAPDSTGPARLLDASTCSYTNSPFGPDPAFGAARVGNDFVFVSSTNVHRFDPTGTLRWNSAATVNHGTEVRPCGVDVCVYEEGNASFTRLSGIDGSRVTAYPFAGLFGSTLQGTVRIDACPGGNTFAAAWPVSPDANCAPAGGATYAIAVVRVRGF